MAEAFADAGRLARAVPDFEPRTGQREMAHAVADLFATGGVLLAEAGTGTGKTLAYLTPAILSRQRVLVSTGTKNLQEQIYFKDLPLLARALDVPVRATYMKGRNNYLCLHRFESFRETAGRVRGALPDADEKARIFLPILERWAATTETGDRAELQELPEDLSFWSEIAATSETCLGTDCPRYQDCFVTRMRQRAAESDVVIVNHHLLCADAAVRQSAYGEVIPNCRHAVIDEAHQLEEVATQYFGISVSNYRCEELARDAERVLASRLVRDGRDDLHAAINRLRDRSRLFFSAVMLRRAADRTVDRPAAESERLQPLRSAKARSSSERGWGPASGENDRVRLTAGSLAEVAEESSMLIGALENLEATLALQEPGDPGEPDAQGSETPADQPFGLEDLLALARRAREIAGELRFVLRASDLDFVYFLETRAGGVFLRAAPIDVSAIVKEFLLDRLHATVLTSATLTSGGSFEYIRSRLGVRHARELRLPSDFDYARQAILYLPRRMPDPRSPSFAAAASREIVEILRRTEGRAFVLFTSYAVMRAVQAIAAPALDYPILVQGSAPRSVLLGQFRSTAHAVLLATSSFWQGVDVIGEALSCVIIDKLPFAPPAEPITAARIEAVAAAGGRPFDDYQIPLAILTLQQGLGRLIRHRRDRGVLAVLDPRLRTMGYGRRFLESLPPAPVTHDLKDVERFFAVGSA